VEMRAAIRAQVYLFISKQIFEVRAHPRLGALKIDIMLTD